MLPVADQDFSQFSVLPPSDLLPTVDELMVGEHLKMLSYTVYALAVGLRSTDAMGAEAAGTVDHAHEPIQVALCAIKHAASIALKVCMNLELARHDKALVCLTFDSDTKAQLLPCPWVMKNRLGASWTRPQSRPRSEVVTNMN